MVNRYEHIQSIDKLLEVVPFDKLQYNEDAKKRYNSLLAFSGNYDGDIRPKYVKNTNICDPKLSVVNKYNPNPVKDKNGNERYDNNFFRKDCKVIFGGKRRNRKSKKSKKTRKSRKSRKNRRKSKRRSRR